MSISDGTLKVIQTATDEELAATPNTLRKLAVEVGRLRKAVALYEASDNLVIKNEDEVERLRAFARSKESNELAIAAELDEANAKLAKAREALLELVAYGVPFHVEKGIIVVLKEIGECHTPRR